jgi:predicted patatin/cPLA2 family phospholipase
MIKRNAEYNKAIDYCYDMEKEGRVFIITPSPEFMIDRLEHDFEKRASLYNHGHIVIQNQIENLLRFLS